MHAFISFVIEAETNPYPAGHVEEHSDAFGPEYFADGHLVHEVSVSAFPNTPG